MLLPTKTLSPARSLLGMGGTILKILDEPKPVSRIWDEYKRARAASPGAPTVTFARFVLSLDLLYAMSLIRYDHGRLVKTRDDSSPV